MKNICKKIILISFIFIIIFSIPSFALYSEKLKVSPTAVQSVKFDEMVNLILGILTVIGVIVAVGGIIIIGIQTMVGSVEKRAVYKQKALPFLAGFVILLLALPIVNLIEGIITKNTYNASKPYSPKYKYEQYVTRIEALSQGSEEPFYPDIDCTKYNIEFDDVIALKRYFIDVMERPIKVVAYYNVEGIGERNYLIDRLDWSLILRENVADEGLHEDENGKYFKKNYNIIYKTSQGNEFIDTIMVYFYPDGMRH